MSNRIPFFFAFIVLLAPAPVWTAENDTNPIPPPQAPFVAEPRPGTRWEIRVQYLADSQKKAETAAATSAATPEVPPNRLMHVQYHRGSDTTKVTLSYSNQNKVDSYICGTQVFNRYDSTRIVTATSTMDSDYVFPFICKGYPGVFWIAADNYVGIDTIEKEKLYHFRREARIPKEGEPPSAYAPEVDAWIRPGEKIPARFKVGTTLYVYSAIQPASTNVELPSELAELMQRVEKERHAAELMRKASQNP